MRDKKRCVLPEQDPWILIANLSDCHRHELFQMLGCCSIAPGFPVLHYLLEFAQTHVRWVDDAIHPNALPECFRTEGLLLQPESQWWHDLRNEALSVAFLSPQRVSTLATSLLRQGPQCWPPQVPPRPSDCHHPDQRKGRKGRQLWPEICLKQERERSPRSHALSSQRSHPDARVVREGGRADFTG